MLPDRKPFEGLPSDQTVVRLERMRDGSVLVESQDMMISTITECSGAVAAAMDGRDKVYAVARRSADGGFRILRLVADRRW